ncbi:MAG: hypothetical protein ACKO4R_02430 [Synechococcales cyanobacterium]
MQLESSAAWGTGKSAIAAKSVAGLPERASSSHFSWTDILTSRSGSQRFCHSRLVHLAIPKARKISPCP